MRMSGRSAPFPAALLLLAGLTLAGCSRVADRRPPIEIRSDCEIVFVHRDKALVTVLPTGGDTVLLGASETTIVAPLWEPEGRTVVVAHNNGLERIAESGEQEGLLDGDAVTALALSPNGERIACSDGRNLILLDRFDGGSERLLDEDFVPRFGNRRIRALAFSSAGERLAFGVGHEVYVLDLRSRSVRRLFEAALGVYWLAWLPENEEIVLLYGRENRRMSVYSPWGTDRSGNYTLVVIGEHGGLRRTLYSAHLVDVRRATPDVSPDGRYVCLSAIDGGARAILIVAVDGSGEVLIDYYGPNSHASWVSLR